MPIGVSDSFWHEPKRPAGALSSKATVRPHKRENRHVGILRVGAAEWVPKGGEVNIAFKCSYCGDKDKRGAHRPFQTNEGNLGRKVALYTVPGRE